MSTRSFLSTVDEVSGPPGVKHVPLFHSPTEPPRYIVTGSIYVVIREWITMCGLQF